MKRPWLLLLLLPLAFSPYGSSQTGSFLEDFEDDELLGPPTGPYSGSTAGTGGFYVSAQDPSQGDQYYRHHYAEGTGTNAQTTHFTFGGPFSNAELGTVATVNWCQAGHIDFWVRFDGAPYTNANDFGNSHHVYFTSSAMTEGFGLYWETSGALKAYAAGGSISGTSSYSGYSAQATLKSGYVAGDWVHIQVKAINCGAAQATFVIPEEERVASVDASGCIPACDARSGKPNTYNIGVTNRVTFKTAHAQGGGLDSLQAQFGAAAAAPAGIPIVAADGTRPMDALVGFSVAVDGSFLTTRQFGAVDAIKVYEGTSLNEAGSDATDFCQIVGGVATYPEAVFYTICEGSATNVDGIRIRAPDMAAAPKPSGCDNECPGAIDETNNQWYDAINIPDTIRDLFTLDYYVYSAGGALGVSYGAHAFVWSTLGGRVGVTAFVYNEPGQDRSDEKSDPFSTQPPTDMCFWRSNENAPASTGPDYIVAVNDVGSTAVYEVIVDIEREGSTWTPKVSMPRIAFDSGNLARANAVTCAGDVAAVRDLSGMVRVFQVVDRRSEGGPAPKTILYTYQSQGTKDRGLALSADSTILFVEDGDDVKVIRWRDDNLTASLPLPTGVGSWVDLATDIQGGVLYVGHTSQITRYNVQDFTCGTTCGTVSTDGAGRLDFGTSTATQTSGPGIVPGGARLSDRLFGGMSLQTRAIVGFVLVALWAFGGYKLAGSAPAIVGGFATLGIMMNVVITLWEGWVVIGIAGMSGIVSFTAYLAKRVGGKA